MVYLICWNVYFGITGSSCGSGDSVCSSDRKVHCLVPVMDVICRIVLDQDTRARMVMSPDDQVAPGEIIGWTPKLLSGSVDWRNTIYSMYSCRCCFQLWWKIPKINSLTVWLLYTWAFLMQLARAGAALQYYYYVKSGYTKLTTSLKEVREAY